MANAPIGFHSHTHTYRPSINGYLKAEFMQKQKDEVRSEVLTSVRCDDLQSVTCLTKCCSLALLFCSENEHSSFLRNVDKLTLSQRIVLIRKVYA
jgi:hypothetical protein